MQDAAQIAQKGRSRALWVGVIGAPVVWAAQFEIMYALSPWGCDGKIHAAIRIATVAGVCLTVIAAILCWREWRQIGGSPDETDSGPIARERFLGALGLFLSLLSTIVILAQGIAGFYFAGCET